MKTIISNIEYVPCTIIERINRFVVKTRIGNEDVLKSKNSVMDAANVGKVIVDAIRMTKKGHEWYDPEILEKIQLDLNAIRESAETEHRSQWPIREKTILKLAKQK